jgi:hypothetical protein
MNNWKVLSLRAELEAARMGLTNATAMADYWQRQEHQLKALVDKLERELIDIGETC